MGNGHATTHPWCLDGPRPDASTVDTKRTETTTTSDTSPPQLDYWDVEEMA